jgi:hypothetical protein
MTFTLTNALLGNRLANQPYMAFHVPDYEPEEAAMLRLKIIRKVERKNFNCSREIHSRDSNGKHHRLIEINGILFYEGVMTQSLLPIQVFKACHPKLAAV